MSSEIRIFSVEDRDGWEAEHEDDGLPSQSWRYAHALSASGIEPRLAVVRAKGARMLMPFFEREWRGHRDIATVPGLSGTSISPSSVAPLSLWRDYAAAQGWVAGYIQLAPSVEASDRLRGESLVTVNSVFLLDLRSGNPLRSASTNVREKLARAAKLGAILIDDRSLAADSLKRLYPETMRRVKANRSYDLSPATLERWALDPSSVLLAARLGDMVDAVSLFCVAGYTAEYHLNASTVRGRDLTVQLIDAAITRLASAGVGLLNLGGGVQPGDGLYRFKRRFNGTPRPLRAVCQIYDQAQYDELCCQAGSGVAGDWFPAYRTPPARSGHLR
jgi:hypothetical protein